MDMRRQNRQRKKRDQYQRRGLAAILAVCLLLTSVNIGAMRSYATEEGPIVFEIGPDVTAELESGVLTISGYGDTDNFTGNTAPFLDYREEIDTLVIEDGITFIGSYLFYGLGNLEGELVLPGSIAGFGNYAFSGGSLKEAPKFSVIRNEFVDAEVVVREEMETPLQEKKGEAEQSGEGLLETSEEAEVIGTETDKETGELEPDVTEESWGKESAVEPGVTEPGVRESSAAESSDGESSQIESSQIESSQIESSQIESSEAGTSATESGTTEPEVEETNGSATAHGKDTILSMEKASFVKHLVPVVSTSVFVDSIQNMETEPSATTESRPTAGEGTTATTNPKTAPETDTTTKPTTEPATEPKTEPAIEPTTEPTTEPATEPKTEPATEPATEPKTEPITGPTTESKTEPITGPTTEPTTEPATESVTESATESVTDPEANQTIVTESSEQYTEIDTESGSETIPKTNNEPHTESGMEPIPPAPVTQYITKQEIKNPQTLFYQGQKGRVICSADNTTFLEAAVNAGYKTAYKDYHLSILVEENRETDTAVYTLIDADTEEAPEVPEHYHFRYQWQIADAQEAAGQDQLRPATPSEAQDLSLSTPSETQDLSLSTPSDAQDLSWSTPSDVQDLSLSTLSDAQDLSWSTPSDVQDLSLSTLLYAQDLSWSSPSDVQDLSLSSPSDAQDLSLSSPSDAQYPSLSTPSNADDLFYGTANLGEPDDGLIWSDIPGANDQIYERPIAQEDTSRKLRCVVTAVSLMRSRFTDRDITLYSDSVSAAITAQEVYVDQAAGDDTAGNGTSDAPVKTLVQAVELLKSKAGSTVESNQIILLADYKLDASTDYSGEQFLKGSTIPVTIKGINSSIQLTGTNENVENNNTVLCSDVMFESLTMVRIGHIYGNGYDIIMGTQLTMKENAPYLYGAGRSNISDKVSNISVASGSYSRIAGYARNTGQGSNNVNGKKAVITVSGSAYVTTIIAGNASGGVLGADVTIYVKGGKVGSLVGGSQGFNNVDSPYVGTTTINISGGTVTDVYAAGSGRAISVPYYKGNLNINVTGGNVSNIYGSGSAAYVISDADKPSHVNITATGGTIGDIYAAGLGGDTNVGSYTFNDITTVLTPETAADCGSLSGNATITIGGNAEITGSIYASGKGYEGKEYSQKNAYLNGRVEIKMSGGTVAKNIFGGGAGSTKAGYETSARVEHGSEVTIEISGGTVEGSIYGGGEYARFEDSTQVTISGGIIRGNVYGGGKEGLVTGKTTVNIKSGEIRGSVYGGALGKTGQSGEGETLVNSGSTVNMTGGWIRSNLYGGSEVSNDGWKAEASSNQSGLVFVNLAGGTVSGKVFGGGYKGRVYGSTHLHIGKEAVGKCNHYKTHPDEMPVLEVSSNLSVGSSVYAGGDFGGNEIDYDQITVEGYSHVYVDGTGYRFGDGGTGTYTMDILGGVFGSGASCDAGDVRLVTLDHYGAPVKQEGAAWDATSTLTSIQRADQVRLIESHVRLTGQSDVANDNQTALYSLNRVGDGQYDEEKLQKLGDLGNSVSLIGGSTLLLDSALIEVANFKSVDSNGQPVALSKQALTENPNLVVLTTGTIFRISHTVGGAEVYGSVTGYSYMVAGDTAEAYAYARIKNADTNSTDGGFAVLGEIDPDTGEQQELEYQTVQFRYRYWKVSGKKAAAVRDTVLTAKTLGPGEKPADGYSVAKGVIELPPAGEGSQYEIKEITIPKGLTLVDAAKQDDMGGGWVTAWDGVSQPEEQARIDSDPLKTFGLFLHPGNGFKATDGKVVSNMTADANNSNTIIGAVSEKVTDYDAATTPQLEFYLTYQNDAITISQDLGNVVVVVERIEGGVGQETITMNVNVVTKASDLSNQTVELYATPSGSYTGKLIIPTGANRTLSLEGVDQSGISLVGLDAAKTGHDVAVTMQPVKGQGWQSADLMENAYDLSKYTSSSSVPIGSTDSRYEAQINFVLYNIRDFESKEATDNLILTFRDKDGKTVEITLEIHWKSSIVSEIKTAAGKQYNDIETNETVSISQESSFTAAYVLNSSEMAEALWLELRGVDGERKPLPAKTKLTLMGPSLGSTYWYQTTGQEADDKIRLNEFTKMWSEGNRLVSDIAKQTLTVIVQFEGTAGLAMGDYSLRLRNDTGADSIGAVFTVNNSRASVTLGGGEGFSKGTYNLTLKLWPGSDTRLTDGAAVVFSPERGTEFPDGVEFTYGGNSYYPINGKVYLILGKLADVESTYQIVMDTTNSPGLEEGNHSLTAEIYSVGINAGDTTINNEGTIIYKVIDNPQYGLKVSLAENGSRVMKPGTTVKFEVAYTIEKAEHETTSIQVRVLKKESGGYTAGGSGWLISGNSNITAATANPQSIYVTVPSSESPGTYRLVFRLGDKETVYNLIVEPY